MSGGYLRGYARGLGDRRHLHRENTRLEDELQAAHAEAARLRGSIHTLTRAAQRAHRFDPDGGPFGLDDPDFPGCRF